MKNYIRGDENTSVFFEGGGEKNFQIFNLFFGFCLSSQVSRATDFGGWKYLLQSVPRISTLKIGALKFTGSWKRISQTQFHLIAV